MESTFSRVCKHCSLLSHIIYCNYLRFLLQVSILLLFLVCCLNMYIHIVLETNTNTSLFFFSKYLSKSFKSINIFQIIIKWLGRPLLFSLATIPVLVSSCCSICTATLRDATLPSSWHSAWRFSNYETPGCFSLFSSLSDEYPPLSSRNCTRTVMVYA